MAIIDPKGLFFGERLASCSDEAQLFWPRYYLAANTVARIELDYTKMLSGPLKSLHKKPSESQWIAVMREYHEKHLMFIYQADGRLWGQFDTDPSNLPRYTTRDSNRSPAPPEENYAKWKDEYATEKAVRNSQGFLDLLTSTANHGESRRVVVPHGDVVHGVGVGVGIGKSKNTPPAVSLPEWVPLDAWEGYVEMRKKIRAPLTDRAVKLHIKELQTFKAEGFDPRIVLELATMRSWRGLYRPNGQQPTPPKVNPRNAADEVARQLREN